MNQQETTALLHHIGTLDGRIHRLIASGQQSAQTICTWANALADVPPMAPAVHWDVRRAVDHFYEQHGGDRSAQYRHVEPVDVLAAWARCKTELMNRHVDPLPEANPDDIEAYLAEVRASRRAVAAGVAPPVEQRQLTSRQPAPEVAARVAATGSPIPPEARRALAPYRALQTRPRNLRRVAPDAYGVGTFSPLPVSTLR
ncbi:hypothetical protein [Streptomyces sp. NPDC046685]|uniref:hypothetical protein n=1 Tax=Streptomyces sp. NPDC046685 TaxID=3157202 RepID=UPI0034061179